MSSNRPPARRRPARLSTVVYGTAAAFLGDMSHAVLVKGGDGRTVCGQDYRLWSVVDFTRPFPGAATGLVCGACTKITPRETAPPRP